MFFRVRVLNTALLVLVTASLAWSQASTPITHHLWNAIVGPLTPNADGTLVPAASRNPGSPICSTETSSAFNVNTDCEGVGAHNEPTIAINPTNANNLIASAHDYQLVLYGGGIYKTVYSRAHVSFDAGKTWTTYPINANPYTATSDPGLAFDADGTAYLSTLGFTWSQGNFCCNYPDVVASTSTDGGQNWSIPARVGPGSGAATSPGIFNDKPWVAAWGHGNAIVTWTEFVAGVNQRYIRSPIMASITHDGGKSWTPPAEISGHAIFCFGAQGDDSCDQSQGSVAAYDRSGFVYVSFLNLASFDTGRDQYLVVKLDPATGTVAGPYQVALVFDGFDDYPRNYQGDPTYQDSEFRTWSFGNLAADPSMAGHLALAWSDMRNSQLPAPPDPYSAKTNSDIIVSESFDGGLNWSLPTPITAPNDQFMPWAAFTSTGLLRIGYFDRSYDRNNHKYGYTIATETSVGSRKFKATQVTTTLSDPTQGDEWFSGVTVNAAYPSPTRFLGDYSAIALFPTGVAAIAWADMRGTVSFAGSTGAAEDAYYGSK